MDQSAKPSHTPRQKGDSTKLGRGQGHRSMDSTAMNTREFSEEPDSNRDNVDEQTPTAAAAPEAEGPGRRTLRRDQGLGETLNQPWKRKRNTPSEEIPGMYFFMGEFHQSFNDKWTILVKTFQKTEGWTVQSFCFLSTK